MTYNEFIFVYGTLRKEASNSMHYVLTQYCEYFSDGTLQGKLYEVNGYPGAIESNGSEDTVKGEIYRIIDRDIVLSKLDEYEECADNYIKPHEYVRKKVEISLIDREKIPAWVYIYNRDVSKCIYIKNGDYLEYLNIVHKID